MNWNRARWKAAHRLWRLTNDDPYEGWSPNAAGDKLVSALMKTPFFADRLKQDPLVHAPYRSRLYTIRNWKHEKRQREVDRAIMLERITKRARQSRVLPYLCWVAPVDLRGSRAINAGLPYGR